MPLSQQDYIQGSRVVAPASSLPWQVEGTSQEPQAIPSGLAIPAQDLRPPNWEMDRETQRQARTGRELLWRCHFFIRQHVLTEHMLHPAVGVGTLTAETESPPSRGSHLSLPAGGVSSSQEGTCQARGQVLGTCETYSHYCPAGWNLGDYFTEEETEAQHVQGLLRVTIASGRHSWDVNSGCLEQKDHSDPVARGALGPWEAAALPSEETLSGLEGR